MTKKHELFGSGKVRELEVLVLAIHSESSLEEMNVNYKNETKQQKVVEWWQFVSRNLLEF